ncbi:MAG: hypothetical protein LUQ50_02605 [Methanospirillum sp.]|uniref:symporter small accessory protein n=1 Tax=Methanospirillum sp. TaxID=45200 RepID=UPI00236B81AA|nr:symporter small accessory protein [Methanospirillum sp.]MDD1727944.1 hypothetical protein [Methanospirillum sp.]
MTTQTGYRRSSIIMTTICGISDPIIIAGYVLSIGFACACIVYGLINWNRGVS